MQRPPFFFGLTNQNPGGPLVRSDSDRHPSLLSAGRAQRFIFPGNAPCAQGLYRKPSVQSRHESEASPNFQCLAAVCLNLAYLRSRPLDAILSYGEFGAIEPDGSIESASTAQAKRDELCSTMATARVQSTDLGTLLAEP